MPEFWKDHVYLIYVFGLGTLGYIVWSFKQSVRRFEQWKDEVTKEIGLIKKNQTDLRAELPEKYVMVRNYEKDLLEIKDLLQRIFDKLDLKMDKGR